MQYLEAGTLVLILTFFIFLLNFSANLYFDYI